MVAHENPRLLLSSGVQKSEFETYMALEAKLREIAECRESLEKRIWDRVARKRGS